MFKTKFNHKFKRIIALSTLAAVGAGAVGITCTINKLAN